MIDFGIAAQHRYKAAFTELLPACINFTLMILKLAGYLSNSFAFLSNDHIEPCAG